MMSFQTKFEYVMVKFQHLRGFENIMGQSLLSEQLRTMERAAFHANECSLHSCEVEIHSENKRDFILIHRKIVNLVPVNKFLISCAAISPYKVSVWHNVLATQTSIDTYLIGSILVTETDSKNKSAANREVRSFLQKAQLLGVFNIFGTSLQCLQAVEFMLNNQRLTCNTLDVFHLPEEYEVVYDNRRLVDHILVRKSQQLANDWIKQYSFPNGLMRFIDETDDVVSAVHPVLDEIFFTETGNISIANVSFLTGGTLLLTGCCCCCFCACCPSCRKCVLSTCSAMCNYLYVKFTSEKFRLRRENDGLRKVNEQSRKTLEKSINEYNLVNQALRALGVDVEDDDISDLAHSHH